MSDPFSLLPFAIAAAGGRVGTLPADALVAAGVTLLQRCVPLVRRLATEPPAILLPPGAAMITALAACDGQVAFVVDANAPVARQQADLDHARYGVLFTLREYADVAPVDVTTVLLDEVPASATVRLSGETRVVDLGSHVGLPLTGARDAVGSEQVVLRFVQGGVLVQVSHADAMHGNGPAWLAPWLGELLAGGQLR